jgi:hypothetical protein
MWTDAVGSAFRNGLVQETYLNRQNPSEVHIKAFNFILSYSNKTGNLGLRSFQSTSTCESTIAAHHSQIRR